LTGPIEPVGGDVRDGSAVAADPRRPGYHVTAPAGWINDPLGVTWHEGPEGGRYELFYQFNPDAPVWAQACRWGQVSASDLVRWRDPRTALEPGPHETGCWSGSVVVDAGVPVIVYTSVLADAPGMGRIALAEGDADWRRWIPDAAGPVVPAPGPDEGFAHVRDPFVWRDGDEWRMAVGAGSTDGRPSVLQYSSPDLRRWRADGVLAAPEPEMPGPGGTVWECPQLFRLDGSWVLLVSVWDDVPGGVACAIGDYDGRRFTPRAWHRLAADPLYATTTFLDAAGRRCAFSWMQEPGPATGAWAGALTVPWVLALDGDRVRVRPHPDVDSLRTGVRAERGPRALGPEPLTAESPDARFDLVLRAVTGGRALTLALADAEGPLLTVVLDPAASQAVVAAPGSPGTTAVPLLPDADGAVDVRMLVDASVAEVFPGGGAAAGARLRPSRGSLELAVTADGPGAWLERLVLHGMERVFP
jgi:beta-fructofuranosidase